MDGILLTVLLLVMAFASGVALQRWLLIRSNEARTEAAKREAQRLLSGAKESAHQYREDYVRESKASLAQERTTLEEEHNNARRQLRRSRQRLERRERKINSRTQRLSDHYGLFQKADGALKILQRETEKTKREAERLRARADGLLSKATAQQDELREREAALSDREKTVAAKNEKLDGVIEQQTRRLVEISGLSEEKAREELRAQVIENTRHQAAAHVQRVMDQANRSARHNARKVVLTAIQRTAASLSVETTVSVVYLDSDDQKGRIIGREGRNIRAFESVTGTEIIVDDTPGAVVLSCFDPVRREVARRALQALVKDGRIHPVSIEKTVKATRKSLEEELVEIGERAVIDLKIHGLHHELTRLIGQMRYRTSYGQNLLAHSVETARISSLIAVEIGLDPKLARRAGLLHDIGKVVTEASDQPHALVGMELCKRFGEDATVCNAVGAHHDEIEMTALISPIVQAADAISGARPGARRATVEEYIRRLEQLERLASSFEGVERVFAFQAGRELRVLVDQNRISDEQANKLSTDISKLIEEKMRYPGQIKVTVIREVRVSAYAR